MKNYVYLFLFMGIFSGSMIHADVKTGNKEIDDSINNRFPWIKR